MQRDLDPKKPKPGVYENIPAGVYHGLPAVSSTTLKKIATHSPLHAHHIETEGMEPTTAMQTGTMAHTALLEPETFDSLYAIGPDCRRGTKEWTAAEEAAPGRTLLKPKDWEAAQAMRRAAWDHAGASLLVRHANHRELTVLWEDEATGLLCKCRPDFVCEPLGLFVDVKTSSSAKPGLFRNQAANLAYHLQLAFYLRGLMANDIKVDDARLLVIETDPPYAVGVFAPDETFMEQGAVEFRCALQTYHECRSADRWPGYCKNETPLTLPAWAVSTDAEEA